MSDISFVDTHVHFWDRPHPTLEWVWLADDFIHPQLGDTVLLKSMRGYAVDEFVAEVDGAGRLEGRARPGSDRQRGPRRGDQVAPGDG